MAEDEWGIAGGGGEAEHDPWAPAPEVSTLGDMAKSAGIGLVKSGIGLAGLPGDLSYGLDKGINWVGSKLGFGEGEPPNPALTSAHLRKLAEHAIGTGLYEPKTTPGQYMQTIGEFAPNLVGGPGSLIAKAATRVLAPAIGSEAAGELAHNYAPALEPVARIAGAVAGHVRPTGAVRAITHEPPNIPSTEDLHQAASQGYLNARGYGVEVRRQPLARLADDMLSDLGTDRFRERNIPQTWSAIEELKSPAGRNATIDDIDSVRKVLNKAGAMPGAEREASRRAIAAIDNYLAQLDPRHVAVNPHYAADVGREIEEARGNWAAMKRSEDVDTRLTAADLRAASTGTGGNIDNATRQNIRALLTNKKAIRGFSQAERDQMERVVRGTFTGNVARLLGRLAPTGVVSAGLGLEIGSHLLHGPAGLGVVPIAGAVAKRIGDASTARQARRLDEMVLARSPLGRSLPQPAPAAPFPAQYTGTSGVLGAEGGEQRASGGRVGNTRAESHYGSSRGKPERHCGPDRQWPTGFCQHYRSPHRCTEVAGVIATRGSCDWFRAAARASGGRTMADGGDPGDEQTAAQDAAEAAAARVRAPYAAANARTSGLPDVGTAIGNRLVSGLMAGPNLMGQVVHGEVDPNSEEGIRRSADVAAGILGYGMMGARPGAAGMAGGRLAQPAGQAVESGMASLPKELYHVASNRYKSGDPIQSLYRRYGDEAYGKYAKRWPEAGDLGQYHAHQNFFYDNLDDALNHQNDFGGKILKVDPSKVEGLKLDNLEKGNTRAWTTSEDIPGEAVTRFKAEKAGGEEKPAGTLSGLPPNTTPGILHMHSQIADMGPEWQNVPVIDHTGKVIHNPINSEHVNGPMLMMDKDGNLSPGILAYHGSPHDFDRFDLSKIGTGEGAQAYGHGLYFAENEGVAKGYREQLTKGNSTLKMPSGEAFDPSTLENINMRAATRKNGPDLDKTIARADDLIASKDLPEATKDMARRDRAKLQAIKDAGGLSENKGSMYQVAIKAPPEHFLDWDAPLNKQKIPKYLKQIAIERSSGEPLTGEALYNALPMAPEKRSQYLREAGIPGIRYLDQGSRLDPAAAKADLDQARTALATVEKQPAGPQRDQRLAQLRDWHDKAEKAHAYARNPTRNYVVFSDDLIHILKKYGIAGIAALPAMNAYHFQDEGVQKKAAGGRVEPTDAQKEAGNYKKRHVTVHGLPIAIENSKGSERSGVGKDGKRWAVKMPADYGYLKRSEGADGDHVDCYLGQYPQSRKVFIVDQKDAETGKFDEHKCMLGFGSAEMARQHYLRGFSDGKGKQRLGHIREMSVDDFKHWLRNGDTTRPAKAA